MDRIKLPICGMKTHCWPVRLVRSRWVKGLIRPELSRLTATCGCNEDEENVLHMEHCHYCASRDEMWKEEEFLSVNSVALVQRCWYKEEEQRKGRDKGRKREEGENAHVMVD